MPYFLKNAGQIREGVHSWGGSVISAGTPVHARPGIADTPTNVAASHEAPMFDVLPRLHTINDDDDKPTKIKVNLPVVATTSSASPAISDTSSLHVHHPQPTKQIHIPEIDDSSIHLAKRLNPQTSSSPSHSNERTSSTQIPETAVHAAPFQPSTFVPAQATQQPMPTAFAPAVPFYYPAFPAIPDYSSSSTQNPYVVEQPVRYEANGMVYYYDPSTFYYFQPPTGAPSQQPQAPQTSGESSNAPSTNVAGQVYYFHPSQIPVADPQRAPNMGMYYPYQQGT